MARNPGDPSPLDAAKFGPVVRTIRKKGPAAGWRLGRDICLRDWETLKEDMPPYAVLKLAIEMDRHALFSEVASDKVKTQRDAEVYEQYQRYLAGEADVAPAAGVASPPITVNGPEGDRVEVDREEPSMEEPR